MRIIDSIAAKHLLGDWSDESDDDEPRRGGQNTIDGHLAALG